MTVSQNVALKLNKQSLLVLSGYF